MLIQQKKVEIIIEVIKTPKITRIIDELGLAGYSVIHGVEGRGSNGTCDAQEVTDVLTNDCVMVICSEDEARQLVHDVQPILKKFGGICFISDAQLLQLS
ncbi:MAG: DUF190 domain-containing protein [Candidatus Babeliales bacterium]